ncbi:MAG: hypothetical protein JKX85_08125 [Phycisphaeraceae bacterium]|nr:hypothetical protein [Phycisphaeraceae bacterium]
MKRNIGFSTGSLARGDFKRAISILHQYKVDVIELSALREPELPILLKALEDGLDLSKFKQISFHAPSKFVTLDEKTLCKMLQPIVARKWNIIVHPDMIQDPAPWRTLGHHLCIENSDPRKPVGQTATEMLTYFDMLPQASWCFDIAHAQQVDQSMSVAVAMLANFSDRLREIHLSRIDMEGKHWALDAPMIQACRRIAQRLDPKVPIILEAVIPPQGIPDEQRHAIEALQIETCTR